MQNNLYEEEAERLLTKVKEADMDVTSEEYKRAMENLNMLRQAEGQKTNSWLSADLLIPALTNIVGIILVINHEQLGVITSKAMSLIGKKN